MNLYLATGVQKGSGERVLQTTAPPPSFRPDSPLDLVPLRRVQAGRDDVPHERAHGAYFIGGEGLV